MDLRIVFAGTPDFARAALEALVGAGHEIVLVLTQPDRRAGRGLQPQASPVKDCALRHGLPLTQPEGLRLLGRHARAAEVAHFAIDQARADVMVVAAYGLILPPSILTLPVHGCLNIHASLLPRWRGAAPIEAGDAETGITIMQMDAGLDTGALLMSARETIHEHDSAATLRLRLQDLGARLIVTALTRLAMGTLAAHAQPSEGASYAHKLTKEEAALHFDAPAELLARRIRAFDPHPGASALCDGVALKLWHAKATGAASRLPFGTIDAIDAAGIHVACNPGSLCITELQRPGGRRLAARQFVQGFALAPGMRFV